MSNKKTDVTVNQDISNVAESKATSELSEQDLEKVAGGFAEYEEVAFTFQKVNKAAPKK